MYICIYTYIYRHDSPTGHTYIATSHMDVSCLMWMSHVACNGVTNVHRTSCICPTHSYVYIYIYTWTWLIHMRHPILLRHIMSGGHDWVMSHTMESCLIWSHMRLIWDTTRTRIIFIWDMTQSRPPSHMRHDSSIWDMTPSQDTPYIATSHMKVSCLMPMSHVAYNWVMSHMTES